LERGAVHDTEDQGRHAEIFGLRVAEDLAETTETAAETVVAASVVARVDLLVVVELVETGKG